MGLFDGIIGGGLGLVGSLLGKGSKARLPDFQPVDATKVQQDAIDSNIASLDRSQLLSKRVNEYDFDSLQNYLRRAIPGYDNIINSQSQAIQSGLKGEIPTDVSDVIAQRSASKALSAGYGDSGMARNLTSRDLGLTSYDIINRSLDSANRFVTGLRTTAVPNLMSSSSMFLTPSQRLSAAVSQNSIGYQAGVAQSEANAAPDPTLASLGNFVGGFGGLMFRNAFNNQPTTSSEPSMMSLLYNNDSGSFGGWRRGGA